MKLSLMTIKIFFQMLMKYQIDHDMEDLLESYEEMMQLVSESGYTAVDVFSTETSLFSEKTVKHVLDRNNLKVSSYIYMAPFAAMDEDGLSDRIKEAKKAVDSAVFLETKVLMLVPQAQEETENYSSEKIREQLIRHWIPVTEYAQTRGIHTVVEDTPDLRLHLCKMQELQEILNAVPGREMVYDSGNMLLVGEDPVDYYESFTDRIAHIHLKDMQNAKEQDPLADTAWNGKKMKGAPTGTGMVHLKDLLKHIKFHGYSRYLSVEFINDSEGDYRQSLIRSKEYLEEILSEN